jgi:hypothetical protein
MRKTMVLIASIVILSGCVQKETTETTTAVETTLQGFQGIGVLDFSPIKNQLAPGASTYLKLRIRNNALGKTARNVIVKLDGLGLYSLLDCLSEPVPFEGLDTLNSEYDVPHPEGGTTTCGALYGEALGGGTLYLYDMDAGLSVIEHGISRLFEGDEYEFYWGIIAPSNAEISGIYYKQDIFYNIQYDYTVENYFNLVAMSSQEFERRRDMGESTIVETDSTVTAGPIGVSQEAQMIEFPSTGQSSLEYSFVVNIANQGEGALSNDKDSVVQITLPEGIEVTENCKTWWEGDVAEVERGGWCLAGLCFCNFIYGFRTKTNNCDTTGTCTCSKQVPVDCKATANSDSGGYMLKTLTAKELAGGYNLQVPFKLDPDEIKYLRENFIPIKTYTFKVEMDYTYNLEDSTSVHTRPIT